MVAQILYVFIYQLLEKRNQKKCRSQEILSTRQKQILTIFNIWFVRKKNTAGSDDTGGFSVDPAEKHNFAGFPKDPTVSEGPVGVLF